MARRRKSIPAGPATLAEVRRRIGAGWPEGLTVLTGDDVYHLDRAQREILDHLLPGERTGFSLTVLGDEKVSTGELVGAARSLGMFASNRVVLLRDLSALEGEKDPIVAYAATPPAGSFLLVRAPKVDERLALHKAIVAAGTVLAFGPPDPRDLRSVRRAVAEMAGERDLELPADALELLVTAAAGDFQRIDSELDKLSAWCGGSGRRRVDADDVRRAVAASGLLSGWELADAVERRDAKGAAAAARTLVDAGEEPLRILGGLAWKARTLLEASGGGPPKPWQRAVGPPRYRPDELIRFPARILRADRALKGGALDPRTVLESLARDLTAGAPTEGGR